MAKKKKKKAPKKRVYGPETKKDYLARIRKEGNMESGDMAFMRGMRGTLGGGLKVKD